MKFYKIILTTGLILCLLISCETVTELLNEIGTSIQGESTGNGDEHKKILTGGNTSNYSKSPSIKDCYEGELSENTKKKVLEKINYIRSLHSLNPVSYNYKDDIYAQKGALIIAANQALSHFPPKNWKCWSEEGNKGCGTSNVFGGTGAWSPDQAIVSWLIDLNVPSLGHRRWMISPFLKTIAYGHVTAGGFTGALLKVVNEKSQETSVDFVAYPYKEYPAGFFSLGGYLSFTVIQDKKSPWGNSNINFKSAKITVSTSKEKLKVTDIASNYEGFGVPNILFWKVRNLKKNTKYFVNINNVSLKKGKKDYEYWFMIK